MLVIVSNSLSVCRSGSCSNYVECQHCYEAELAVIPQKDSVGSHDLTVMRES